MAENNSNSIWRDLPVLVTGASGLVGSWLLKSLLSKGANVTCVVRDWVPDSEMVRAGLLEQVHVVRGDICDRSLLERALADTEATVVFHLAAQTIVSIAQREPVSTFETNVQGTWNLLEACRRTGTAQAIVIASSDKAYGAQPDLPYTEAMPLSGSHPYDASKSCADLIAKCYANTYGLPVAITRCGNFFGGGDLNWNRIVPGTIRAVLRGAQPIIRSDGNYIRDYFYVEDGVAAYLLLAEKMLQQPELKGEAFNFSNEEPLTVRELVDRILNVMDSTLEPIVRNETSFEIRAQHLAAGKAQSVLGWRRLFELDQALKLTVNWYKDYFDELKARTSA